jgi:hypothetical protein
MLPLLHLLLSSPLQQVTPLRIVLREDFDEPGTSWAATLFPDEIIPGGAAFTREELSGALGAPDTSPPLPINTGGDLEGRYAEVTASGGSYALGADVPSNRFEDAAIRGYLAIGAPDPFGGQTVGFLLRASVNPNPPFGTGLNAYTAEVVHNQGQPTALLVLARWRDSVITAGDTFATASFPVDLGAENYLLEFRVQGDLLTARLWRVTASGGSVAVDPIPLGTGPSGPTSVLRAHDPELTSGRAGVSAFARGGNSVFWDDVELGQPGDKLGRSLLPPLPPVPARRAQAARVL